MLKGKVSQLRIEARSLFRRIFHVLLDRSNISISRALLVEANPKLAESLKEPSAKRAMSFTRQW